MKADFFDFHSSAVGGHSFPTLQLAVCRRRRAPEGPPSTMSTSTRVFDNYEREYLKLNRQAMQDVELIDQLLPGAERDATVQKVQKAITAVEEIVESMQLEARAMSGASKQQLVAQTKDYKAGIALLKSRLREVQTSSKAQEAARNELLRGSDPTLRQEADNQRSRLMATNERLSRGTDKLKAATQIALETEVVGQSIMADLETQRDLEATSAPPAASSGSPTGVEYFYELPHSHKYQLRF